MLPNIASAWRMIIYAAALITVFFVFERKTRHRFPIVRYCALAVVVMVIIYSGTDLIPFYLWHRVMNPTIRFYKNIVVGLGLIVVLAIFVPFILKHKHDLD